MIDNALQAVDQLLLSVLGSSVPLLHDASQHILAAGGKRLRPRLVLLSYRAAGGHDDAVAVPLAAAVEIIHTATLVHDDINDQGTLRRGRETVNARWGRTFALLTGDFLFAKAYQLMLTYSPELNQLLANAAVELVEGETLQIQTSREGKLTRDLYFEIIAKKTASLFVASTALGAVAADAPREWVDALRRYAYHLGLSFQIVDDILDLVADPQQLGKNAGIDVGQGRGLAVALGGSSTIVSAMQTALAEIGSSVPPEDFQDAMLKGQTFDQAVEKGREKAREMADLAAESLSILPPSPAVDELVALTRQVVERDH